MTQIVFTEKAPKAIGPYSQGIQVGNLLFLSGQIPVDPSSNNVVENDIVIQTNQVMKNIEAILKSQQLSFENIVKQRFF